MSVEEVSFSALLKAECDDQLWLPHCELANLMPSVTTLVRKGPVCDKLVTLLFLDQRLFAHCFGLLGELPKLSLLILRGDDRLSHFRFGCFPSPHNIWSGKDFSSSLLLELDFADIALNAVVLDNLDRINHVLTGVISSKGQLCKLHLQLVILGVHVPRYHDLER